MKRIWNLCVLWAVCSFLSGCGSPGRMQQSEVVPQEYKAQNIGALQEVQGIQTDWDAEAESARKDREALSDVEEPIPKPEDGDGSKYHAEFLGNDSSKITSCVLYHNGKKEALDVSTAKGKYLIQMLSGYFRDWECGYSAFAGGMGIDWLEEVSKEELENYYIKLQIEDSAPITFHEISPGFENMHLAKGYDTVIIEANFDIGVLVLFWNRDGDDVFWGDAPNIRKIEEDFREKYQEWETITDWDRAFEELQAAQALKE